MPVQQNSYTESELSLGGTKNQDLTLQLNGTMEASLFGCISYPVSSLELITSPSRFEQVGLQKILSLLESEDAEVRIHAVKVVANLAAEEAKQEKIVEAGGLTSLLMLLRGSGDEMIRRVAAGAIANLAMNESNQELRMGEGGISLLSMTAADAEDPQTLRMVAGAIANLCGNDVGADLFLGAI